MARILKDQLQQLPRVKEVPQSQCGLWKGRGCSDIIIGVLNNDKMQPEYECDYQRERVM